MYWHARCPLLSQFHTLSIIEGFQKKCHPLSYVCSHFVPLFGSHELLEVTTIDRIELQFNQVLCQKPVFSNRGVILNAKSSGIVQTELKSET